MVAGQHKELLKIQRNGITLSAANVGCGIWQQRPEAKQSRNGGYVMSKKLRPFAPIDHLVIDSPAFADLKGESVRVLLIIARQYDGRNNGHLQATFSYCKDRGIGSEHTVRTAIAELINHGFIYRTRSHGFEAGKNSWSRYAITWRPLCDTAKRKGLFVDGFLINAWQKWPFEKNSDPQNVQEVTGKKCSFMGGKTAQSAGNRPAESAAYELLAITGGCSEVHRFDYLSAELRKQAIKGRKQGSRKNFAFSVTTPQPCKTDWRH